MCEFAVIMHPRSRQTKLTFMGDVLHAWVTAPPVEGAANDALIALLAKALSVPRSRVTIVRGATARHKRIAVAGLSAEEVRAQVGSAEE
jgi:uncharacterized protein